MIRFFLGNMVQLAPKNATTVMNGEIFQIIALKFLLIVSVTETTNIRHCTIIDTRWFCSQHWWNHYTFKDTPGYLFDLKRMQ